MKKYPAFFFGHWSPLNAILDTPFSREWEKIGKTLEKPKAIISISAHFERQGTYITAMNSPKTIYDFSWFPEELYQVHYPMKWSQKIANEIMELGLFWNFYFQVFEISQFYKFLWIWKKLLRNTLILQKNFTI